MNAPTLQYTRLQEDPDEAHQKVLDIVKGARRILEVGAATGYMTRALQSMGYEVVATEPDPRAVAEALTKGTTIRQGILRDALDPSERGSFDCVIAADVLEHVLDGPEFLLELRTCLLEGGHLVLSVPNVAHWSVRLALLRGTFEYTSTGLLDKTHVRFYTRASLIEAVEAAGFDVVERQVTLGLHVYPQWTSHNLRWYQRRLVRVLAKWRPTLFSYQFVLKARVAGY